MMRGVFLLVVVLCGSVGQSLAAPLVNTMVKRIIDARKPIVRSVTRVAIDAGEDEGDRSTYRFALPKTEHTHTAWMRVEDEQSNELPFEEEGDSKECVAAVVAARVDPPREGCLPLAKVPWELDHDVEPKSWVCSIPCIILGDASRRRSCCEGFLAPNSDCSDSHTEGGVWFCAINFHSFLQ